MTSHREAPLITMDPVADSTDLYAFRDPADSTKVSFIANYIPFEEPAGGPNFHKFDDNVLYEIRIDNNGDGVADITYQFTFTSFILNRNTFLYNVGPISFNPSTGSYDNLNVFQTYTVTRLLRGQTEGTILAQGLRSPPVNIGPKSTPDYASKLVPPAIYTIPGGRKVFAGQRGEGFYVDLGATFDLLVLRPLAPAHGVPPSLQASPGVHGLSGFNVHSIALQVPITEVTSSGKMPEKAADADAVIGIWTTASRRTVSLMRGGGVEFFGHFTQISRLGNPLVNEVLIPLDQKDVWNATEPKDDAKFARYFLNPEPAGLIPVLYPGVKVPAPPRADIEAILLTGFSLLPLNLPFTNFTGQTRADMLRLNLAVPPNTNIDQSTGMVGNRHGILGGDLAGFPNGRRVSDDVVDIELRALAGATPFTPAFNVAPNNAITAGLDKNDVPFLTSFPYLPTPHQGFSHKHKHE